MTVKPVDASTPVRPSPEAKERLEQRRKREAVRGFEEIFLRQMLAAMRNTVPVDGEESVSKRLWKERFDAEIARRISETGGFGLGRLLEAGIGGKDPPK
ncbi:MAG: hypothetical protein Kow00128_00340 [Deltaproteobacteria bacterium]